MSAIDAGFWLEKVVVPFGCTLLGSLVAALVAILIALYPQQTRYWINERTDRFRAWCAYKKSWVKFWWEGIDTSNVRWSYDKELEEIQEKYRVKVYTRCQYNGRQ